MVERPRVVVPGARVAVVGLAPADPLAAAVVGDVFTSPPVSLPAGQFGLGHGSGAHAPNEYFVIESSNPKVQGLVGSTMSYVDFLYEIAAAK